MEIVVSIEKNLESHAPEIVHALRMLGVFNLSKIGQKLLYCPEENVVGPFLCNVATTFYFRHESNICYMRLLFAHQGLTTLSSPFYRDSLVL